MKEMEMWPLLKQVSSIHNTVTVTLFSMFFICQIPMVIKALNNILNLTFVIYSPSAKSMIYFIFIGSTFNLKKSLSEIHLSI